MTKIGKNPIIAMYGIGHEAKSLTAQGMADRLVDAVLPICWQRRPNERPVHEGTCVAVSIGDQMFLFSASHVFESMGEYAPLVAVGGQVVSLGGDRFSTARGASGTHVDDPIDASVFHVQAEIPPALRAVALSLEDLAIDCRLAAGDHLLLTGFRAKDSRMDGRFLRHKYSFVSASVCPDSTFHEVGRDPELVCLGRSADENWRDGKMEQAPLPKGMSGGAMIHIEGLPRDPFTSVDEIGRPMLAAIFTGVLKDRLRSTTLFAGTRVVVHLSLIAQHLPELLKPEQFLGGEVTGKDG